MLAESSYTELQKSSNRLAIALCSLRRLPFIGSVLFDIALMLFGILSLPIMLIGCLASLCLTNIRLLLSIGLLLRLTSFGYAEDSECGPICRQYRVDHPHEAQPVFLPMVTTVFTMYVTQPLEPRYALPGVSDDWWRPGLSVYSKEECEQIAELNLKAYGRTICIRQTLKEAREAMPSHDNPREVIK